MPLMSVYAIGFAAVALGLARGVFESFVALAQEKRPRGARFTLKENPAVHDEVARAGARIRGARAFLVEAAEAGAADLADAGRMSLDTLMTIRLAGTHAIHEAKAAADILFDTAGTSAVMASSPFERRFRDIHAVGAADAGQEDAFPDLGLLGARQPGCLGRSQCGVNRTLLTPALSPAGRGGFTAPIPPYVLPSRFPERPGESGSRGTDRIDR